jgi:two-component sensor histidine kinase
VAFRRYDYLVSILPSEEFTVAEQFLGLGMALDNVLSIRRGRDLTPSDNPGFDRSQEADHRIANGLALIDNFIGLRAAHSAERAAGHTADEVKVLLAGMAYRIDAIGGLHKVLSTEPAKGDVDLSEHLQKMCSAMRPFVSLTARLELCCDPRPDCMVPADHVALIALIVSEMVTNAVKHAHPAGVAGRIDVGCHLDGSRIIVEVADDGVGLPENFDVLGGGALGFKMVRALATQLGALPIFDSCPLGLRFMLLLPK